MDQNPFTSFSMTTPVDLGVAPILEALLTERSMFVPQKVLPEQSMLLEQASILGVRRQQPLQSQPKPLVASQVKEPWRSPHVKRSP